MAVTCYKFLNSILPNINGKFFRFDSLKYFSQYPASFHEPILDREAIEEELKKSDKVSFRAVKACPNDSSVSVHSDPEVRYFTRLFMKKGQKDVARRVMSETFRNIKQMQLREYYKEKDEEKRKSILIRPKEVFKLAVQNTIPVFELRKVRKSGTWYQVPKPTNEHTAKFEAMRWILQEAGCKESNTRFSKSLAIEILATSKKEGKAYARKINHHKLCEANRAYSHYKFG